MSEYAYGTASGDPASRSAPKMMGYIGVSLAALVLVAFAKASPLWGLAAVAPLAVYHLRLASLLKDGLADPNGFLVDSVYYFGFLITVFALAVTAFTIAGSSESPDLISTILQQFGAGLFATGYAVVARLHLMGMTSAAAHEAPEEAMARAAKRCQELVNVVDDAVVRTRSFADDLVVKSEAALENGVSAASAAMANVALSFRNEMTSALRPVETSLADVRVAVLSAEFAGKRDEFVASLARSAAESARFAQALADMTERTQVASAEVRQGLEGMQRVLPAIRDHLTGLGAPDGTIPQAVRSAEAMTRAFEHASASAADASGRLSDLGHQVEEAGPAFHDMKKTSKLVHEQLAAFSSVTGALAQGLTTMNANLHATQAFVESLKASHAEVAQLRSGMAELAGTARVAGSTIHSMHGVEGAVESLRQRLEALIGSMTHAQGAIQASSEGLRTAAIALGENARSSAEAARVMEQSLIGVAQGIIDGVTRQAR